VGVTPGDYVLKIAVSDGVRVGSIEHSVHASLAGAGELKLSDLTAGGPVPSTSAPARPTVDDTIYFGALHGYVEAYGDAAACQVLVESCGFSASHSGEDRRRFPCRPQCGSARARPRLQAGSTTRPQKRTGGRASHG